MKFTITKEKRAKQVDSEGLRKWVVAIGGNILNLQFLLQMKPLEVRVFAHHVVERTK